MGNTLNEFFKQYEEKRQQALDYLGKKWVLHPNYQHDPKHKIDMTGKFSRLTARVMEQA